MDQPPKSTTTTPTGLLAGRYELGAALGRGRSTVYRGTDTRLRRPVAVKHVELASGLEDADRVRTRALREARAAAALNDPCVVAVYDVVEEAGAIWLVMEQVEAPSLSQLVEDGALGHPRAARVGLDVLTALEAAHRVGIVHRDLKPANVLVLPGDRAKLTDFGVASIRDESRLTMTGLIVGSPSYMAPEQARGAEVGPAADLWALGAMLFYATEGEPPFLGDSALATASAVVNGDPRPARSPGALTGLIARLLTKDPDIRATAAETRAALRRVAGPDRTDATAAYAKAPAPPTAPAPPAVPPPVRPEVPQDATPTAVPAAPPVPPPAPTAVPGPTPAPTPVPTGGERAALAAGAAAAFPPVDAPRRRYEGPRRSGSRPGVLVAAAAAVLLLVAVVIAARAGGDGGGGDPNAGGGTATATTLAPTTAAQEPTATTAAPSTTLADGAIPADWRVYRSEAAGYTVGYPRDWQVRPADGPRIDFVNPKTGAYLRVDWTATPGDDPTADWRRQAQGFARSHPGYQEIGIAPADYRDYNAALWEFRYGNNRRLHVANLGFVTGGKGYALLYQAPESEWAKDQAVLRQLKRSFRPG